MKPEIERYVESARPEFEAKLQEWVEIPTISAEPDHKPDIDRGADAAIQYLRSLGADAEKVDTPGNPVVVGRFVTGKDRPVGTIYNHLDVQPANEPQWRRGHDAVHKQDDKSIGRGLQAGKRAGLTQQVCGRCALVHR